MTRLFKAKINANYPKMQSDCHMTNNLRVNR